MTRQALIFMATAWAFVLGLVSWSYWKLLQSPKDDTLPPPGTIS